MTLLLFVALTLAIWRVTRLLVQDEFPPVAAVRRWVIRTFATIDEDGEVAPRSFLLYHRLGYSIAYLWTCPWCMSIWVGAGIVWLADWRLSVPYPYLIVAVGSLVSGWSGMAESAHEQRYVLRQREIRDGEREPRTHLR